MANDTDRNCQQCKKGAEKFKDYNQEELLKKYQDPEGGLNIVTLFKDYLIPHAIWEDHYKNCYVTRVLENYQNLKGTLGPEDFRDPSRVDKDLIDRYIK